MGHIWEVLCALLCRAWCPTPRDLLCLLEQVQERPGQARDAIIRASCLKG